MVGVLKDNMFLTIEVHSTVESRKKIEKAKCFLRNGFSRGQGGDVVLGLSAFDHYA
jgi:hypothetical protein